MIFKGKKAFCTLGIVLFTTFFVAKYVCADGDIPLCFDELTLVPDELLEKVIVYEGKVLGYGVDRIVLDGLCLGFRNEDKDREFTSYRLYPCYDLEGDPVSYEVMYYFGEGEVPSDEEILGIAEKIFEQDLNYEERMEIYKEEGIYEKLSTVTINCYYELEPVSLVIKGEIPGLFRKYIETKDILEEQFKDHEIEFSDFKGCVLVIGDSSYFKFEIEGEEIYVHALSSKIFTKGELLNRVKPLEEIFSKETIEKNIVKWEEIEERFDELESELTDVF